MAGLDTVEAIAGRRALSVPTLQPLSVRVTAQMRLGLWVGIRLGMPALLLAVRPTFVGDLLARLLESAAYAHGLVKLGLEAWMVVLYRAPTFAWTTLVLSIGAAVIGVLGGRAPRVPGKPRTNPGSRRGAPDGVRGESRISGFGRRVFGGEWGETGAQLVAIALLLGGASIAPLDPWWPAWAVLCGLLALHLGPWPLPGWIAWIPGSELLFPRAVATGLGISPFAARVVQVLTVPLLLGAWLLVDSAVVGDSRRGDVGRWPAERVDPRARILEEAPPGVICEYHDVDLVGDRLVVVAEGSHRLLSFPLAFDAAPAVWTLPPPWWSIDGLVLDSESDPTTGRTWFLDGPEHISSVMWSGTGAGWRKEASSPALRHHEHHVYTRWLPDLQELVLVSINAGAGQGEGTVMRIPTPSLTPVRQRSLRVNGTIAPIVRDIAWLPTLGRMVVAPNWGDRLYLLDPDTGVMSPWIAVPTMNGKMTWSSETNRLYLAQPNRMSVAVIDVDAGVIERTIPTQPGVRPVAIDATRGWMVTASVVTGQVWVQRLDDGAIVDHFGTFMPMVRELTLDVVTGTAFLSTWTALYAVPYAGGTLPPAPPRAPVPVVTPTPAAPGGGRPTPPPAAPR